MNRPSFIYKTKDILDLYRVINSRHHEYDISVEHLNHEVHGLTFPNKNRYDKYHLILIAADIAIHRLGKLDQGYVHRLEIPSICLSLNISKSNSDIQVIMNGDPGTRITLRPRPLNR